MPDAGRPLDSPSTDPALLAPPEGVSGSAGAAATAGHGRPDSALLPLPPRLAASAANPKPPGEPRLPGRYSKPSGRSATEVADTLQGCNDGAMATTHPHLVSIGYEGRSVDDLVNSLLKQDVQVLVDVRLNPISRKPGLSKTALSTALNEAGITYIHHRELGNPKDNRDDFRRGTPESHARFRALLGEERGAAALRHVSELLEDSVVALLCFERDHSECHRTLVVDAIAQQDPGLSVAHV